MKMTHGRETSKGKEPSFFKNQQRQLKNTPAPSYMLIIIARNQEIIIHLLALQTIKVLTNPIQLKLMFNQLI